MSFLSYLNSYLWEVPPFLKVAQMNDILPLKMPREAVESSTLETVKSHMDIVLGNLPQLALLRAGSWSR